MKNTFASTTNLVTQPDHAYLSSRFTHVIKHDSFLCPQIPDLPGLVQVPHPVPKPNMATSACSENHP